jgi:hypothetical protein
MSPPGNSEGWWYYFEFFNDLGRDTMPTADLTYSFLADLVLYSPVRVRHRAGQDAA